MFGMKISKINPASHSLTGFNEKQKVNV